MLAPHDARPHRAEQIPQLGSWNTRLVLFWALTFTARTVWLQTRLRRRKALAQSTLHSLARWSLDFVSAVFLAVVVAFVQAAPPVAGLSLLAGESVFFIWYSKRLNHLNGLGLTSRVSDACSSLVTNGIQLFMRLVDEREGALPALRAGAHLNNWFVHEGKHERPIGVGNVADLLDTLLMQGQAKNVLTEDAGLLDRMAKSLWSQLGMETQQEEDNSEAELNNPAAEAASGGSATSSTSSTGSSSTYTTGATPISPADKPLMACYRPLLFYVLMEAIAGWAHVSLTLRLGFTRASVTPTATYYVKQAARRSSKPPIVFLHGIGVGLAPYLAFLSRLASRTGRTIIAVQYKHVSMRMTHHVPSAQEVAADVEAFLDAQGHASASLLAHSYGTLVASSMVKRRPARVATLTLLDPVCFAMFLPHLLRNSLFFHVGNKAAAAATAAAADNAVAHSAAVAAGGVPADGGIAAATASVDGESKSVFKGWRLRNPLRGVNPLKGVVVRDVHVAAALSRNSYWADVNLWPTDLPAHAPTTVVLSGLDHLVPVQEVSSMLSSGVALERGVKLQVHEGRGHGAFVVDPAMQDTIIIGLGGVSEAVQEARQRGAKAARRRSLDVLAEVAVALQSLVQSLQDTLLGEQVSESALRMLAGGLPRTSGGRSARAAPGGGLSARSMARGWATQRARAAAKYAAMEVPNVAGCSGTPPAGCSGDEAEAERGARLMAGGRRGYAAASAGGRGGAFGVVACSGGGMGVVATVRGVPARLRAGGFAAVQVARRAGLRGLRPWVRAGQPLRRLAPMLRAWTGLLAPRRSAAGIKATDTVFVQGGNWRPFARFRGDASVQNADWRPFARFRSNGPVQGEWRPFARFRGNGDWRPFARFRGDNGGWRPLAPLRAYVRGDNTIQAGEWRPFGPIRACIRGEPFQGQWRPFQPIRGGVRLVAAQATGLVRGARALLHPRQPVR